MFDSFNPKDKSLTSLDLGTPPPRKPAPAPPPKSEPAAAAKPPMAQVCVAQVQTLEGAYIHFAGARQKFEQMVKADLKPEILFYIVFPQQGLSHTLTTNDGLKTAVPLFTSKVMAEAYLSARKLPAVAAACRIENLPQQAEKWTTAGINSYALNICCKCLAMNMYPLAELESEDLFLSTWRLDLANRRQFAEVYGRNAAGAVSANPKQARIWLEGIRDHIDPANPYLHWVIAVLAGMAGDMEANSASIKRLDAFGPPFQGKLQGTSFDPTVPGSQLSTMAEGLLGLGVSLGYIDLSKMQQEPKPPKE